MLAVLFGDRWGGIDTGQTVSGGQVRPPVGGLARLDGTYGRVFAGGQRRGKRTGRQGNVVRGGR